MILAKVKGVGVPDSNVHSFVVQLAYIADINFVFLTLLYSLTVGRVGKHQEEGRVLQNHNFDGGRLDDLDEEGEGARDAVVQHSLR
jgi:hypothetical protein